MANRSPLRSLALVVPLALGLWACGRGAGDLLQAEEDLREGRYNEAAVLLQNAVESDQPDARAQILLARTQLLRSELAAVEKSVLALANNSDPVVEEIRAQLLAEKGQFLVLQERIDSGALMLPPELRTQFLARSLQGRGAFVEALELAEEGRREFPDSVELALLAAENNAALGRREAALGILDSIIDSQPGAAKPWALKAGLLSRTDPSAAREARRQALRLAPGQLNHSQWGLLLAAEIRESLNRRQLDAAAGDFEVLVSQLPGSPLTAWVDVEHKLARGSVPDAVSTSQLLLRNFPDQPFARPALVGALLASGSLEQASNEIGILAAAADEKPRFETAARLVTDAAAPETEAVVRKMKTAEAAVQLEQFVAARVVLEEALADAPRYGPAELALLQLELRTRQYEEALRRAKSLLEKEPGNPVLLSMLAEAQAATGSDAEALATYESLWSILPNGPTAVALTKYRLLAGDADALRPIGTWVESHPDDVSARIVLAAALQQSGRPAEARREYERVLDRQPGNAVALNNLAWVLHEAGEPAALELARKAHEVAGAVPSIADTYGWLLAQSGRTREALPLLERAARADPANPTIRYHLAATQLEVGGEPNRAAARRLLLDLGREERDFEGKSEARELASQLDPA